LSLSHQKEDEMAEQLKYIVREQQLTYLASRLIANQGEHTVTAAALAREFPAYSQKVIVHINPDQSACVGLIIDDLTDLMRLPLILYERSYKREQIWDLVTDMQFEQSGTQFKLGFPSYLLTEKGALKLATESARNNAAAKGKSR
jgi:hypothetical protein